MGGMSDLAHGLVCQFLLQTKRNSESVSPFYRRQVEVSAESTGVLKFPQPDPESGRAFFALHTTALCCWQR